MAEHSEVTKLSGTARAEEHMRIVSAVNSALSGAVPDCLRLNLFHSLKLSAGGETALFAEVGRSRYPILVADDLRAPKRLAFAGDTTWKWAMSPDPEVRRAYAVFWRRIFDWLCGESRAGHALAVTFRPDSNDDACTLVTTRGTGGVEAREFRDVKLDVTADQDKSTINVTAADNELVHVFRHSGARPAVIWFRASAELHGRVVTSERRPLLLEPHALEFFHSGSAPEPLAALAEKGGGDFAHHAGARSLVERLLERVTPKQTVPDVHERRPRRESFIAAVAFMLLAAEWFLERAASARAGLG